MPIICPTVTAFNKHQYRQQMERLKPFAGRIHIDLMDGHFAMTKSPGLSAVWWPDGITADIHLMYQRPMDQLDHLIKLKPNLVVIHAEAEVEPVPFAIRLHEHGIKSGLALLQTTPLSAVAGILPSFDHVLIFSGHLGHHGGQADLGLLDKVRVLRNSFPNIEISWDGGINDQNARQLTDAGVDVLNTGGFIQNAENPSDAYAKLEAVIETV